MGQNGVVMSAIGTTVASNPVGSGVKFKPLDLRYRPWSWSRDGRRYDLTSRKKQLLINNLMFRTGAEFGQRRSMECSSWVEDTILITETGCENLTAGIPRTIKEIEEIMKKEGIPQILRQIFRRHSGRRSVGSR